MRVRAVIGVAVLGVFGALAVYACDRGNRGPEATQIDAPACDSCGARKKDLSRLREALSTPADGSD